MHEKKPSRTALGAATHRATHQILEKGRIFADPLALTILGKDAKAARRYAAAEEGRGLARWLIGDAALRAHRGMRVFIAARSRVAETVLSAGVETRGVSQLVVLGAGLDTFAYRNPFEGRLRVFEVDHPATQAWKRRRLGEVGIGVPGSLTFTPVDFERDNLLDALEGAGFDPARRTFFTWLGVVPYLTKDAVSTTLALIGALPGGAEVVFDYSDPPASLPEEARAAHLRRAARVADAGEPFLSYFEPAELHRELEALGLGHIDDLGPGALVARYLAPGASSGPPRERGGHVLFAATSFL